MFFSFIRHALCVVCLLGICTAQAGIVINTTRVIYPAEDREVSFGVYNNGSGEILLQSWLEPYGLAAEAPQGALADLPFIMTPALARLGADGKQLVRIIHAGRGLPADRESVFWINVQEIPQVARENTLQIAVRQRIKLFFRPRELPGDPARAAGQLQWRLLQGDRLEVFNPGPYHVSMLGIVVRQAERELARHESRMIAPQQRWQVSLKPRSGSAALDLSFIAINDFGGQEPYAARLQGDALAQAGKVP